MKPVPDHFLARTLRPALVAVALGVAVAVTGCSLLPGHHGDDTSGQPAEKGESDEAQPESAFDIVVQSDNEALRELVQKHNNLQRYRVISDLDATELARLTALTEDDVRGLLATQGYFNPEITVTTETADDGRTAVVIALVPGELTQVAKADIRFAGDIADSDAASEQRQAITEAWTRQEGRTFTQDDWSGAKNNALRQLISTRYAKGRIEQQSGRHRRGRRIGQPGHRAGFRPALLPGPGHRARGRTLPGRTARAPVLAEAGRRL